MDVCSRSERWLLYLAEVWGRICQPKHCQALINEHAGAARLVHFHDLRHAGNTLTADAGASLRELMDRMGHSSTRAALIYQHSSDERQRKLADAVGEAARAALLNITTPSRTHVARDANDQS